MTPFYGQPNTDCPVERSIGEGGVPNDEKPVGLGLRPTGIFFLIPYCFYSTAFSTGLPQTMFRLPLRSRSSSRNCLVETPSRSVIL